MEPDGVEVPSPTEVAVALDVLGRLAEEWRQTIATIAQCTGTAVAYRAPADIEWLTGCDSCSCSRGAGAVPPCLEGQAVEGRCSQVIDVRYEGKSVGTLVVCCTLAHKPIQEAICHLIQAAIRRLELKARTVIKAQLPNAWVAPSWGGWIATFDEPASGAGRSMIPAFAPMLRQMDGVAFQAMRPRSTGEYHPDLQGPDPGNPTQILRCCEIFSRYHNSFMVSHYEPSIKAQHPDGGRADTVTHDFLLMIRLPWIKAVTRLGLDKLSLMHYTLYKGNPYNALVAAETFQEVLRQGSKASE